MSRREPSGSQSNNRSSACQARYAPSRKKNDDADAEQLRIRSHRPRGEHVDEQQPHTDELRESTNIEQDLHDRALVLSRIRLRVSPTRPARLASPQIRSKFFSISRRVSLNMTGRPCGQIVEY